MFLKLVIFCATGFLAGTLPAAEIIGTLYGQTGGASGRGIGEVRLATSECVLNLTYQRPLKVEFTNQSCWELGAQWTARATIVTPGEGVLERSQCSGAVDKAIHSAWIAAQEFLDAFAAHEFDRALAVRSPHARETAFKNDSINIADLDLSSYRKLSSGRCLGVLVKRSETEVIINSGLDCFIRKGSRDVSLSLLMVPGPNRDQWKLESLGASFFFSE